MLRLLACALLAGIASAQVTYYSASLDPAQEVPATASTGRGWGIVRLDASTNGVQLFCYHTGLTSTSIIVSTKLLPSGARPIFAWGFEIFGSLMIRSPSVRPITIGKAVKIDSCLSIS